MAASRTMLKVNIDWIEAEQLVWPECKSRLERYDGILVPGGFGKRGVEGMINAIRLRARGEGSVLRHMPRHADDGDRVCPQRLRTRDGEFDRIRSCDAQPRHLQASRTERCRRIRRHHASGRLSLPAWPKEALPAQPTQPKRSVNVIAIATSSIASSSRSSPAHGLKLTGQTPDGVYVEICEIANHPVVSRLPVPSRVQVEAAGAASAVQRIYRRVVEISRAEAERRLPANTRMPVEFRTQASRSA